MKSSDDLGRHFSCALETRPTNHLMKSNNQKRKNSVVRGVSPSQEAKNSLFLNRKIQKVEKKDDPDDIDSRDFKTLISTALRNAPAPNATLLQEEKFEKRSMEQYQDSQNHQYFVFPISSCSS